MKKVPLAVVPNQKFSITLDDQRYSITLQSTNSVTSCTIVRGGTLLVSGMRCVAGTPLLPYERLEAGSGNFIFLTQNESLPYYTEFNSTQFLFYASQSEIDAIRALPKNLFLGGSADAVISILRGFGIFGVM